MGSLTDSRSEDYFETPRNPKTPNTRESCEVMHRKERRNEKAPET